MPKKKPVDRRLKSLFEDLKPEQSPAEVKPAPTTLLGREARSARRGETNPAATERGVFLGCCTDPVSHVSGVSGRAKFLGNAAGRR